MINISLTTIGNNEMAHTQASLHGHIATVMAQTGAIAKKNALFDIVQGMVVASLAEQKALGVTDHQQTPFTDTIALFNAMRAAIVAVDLS